MATAAPDAVEMELATPETTLTESSLMATPAGKTSTVGVRMVKKKKANLNISKRKLKSVPATPVNFSFHNMSVQKQTLRANNKALAQNLAKMRLEVRRLQKENTDLERHNQETQHELRRLKRVVGIKDVEIEDEVQKRIQIHMLDMKKSVENVAEYLGKMGEGISEIYQKCADSAASSRASSLSNRSSLANLLNYSSDSQRRSSVNRRSSFSSLLQAEFLAKADEVASNHLGDREAGRRLSDNMSETPVVPADMSVILEQSVLTEEIVTGSLKSNLPAVSESVNQENSNGLVGNGRNTKLPQRIPRQTSRENLRSNVVTDKTSKNNEVSDVKKDSVKDIVTDATKPKSKKRDKSDAYGQNETEKKSCLSEDSSNNVKDSIETDKRRTRSISKDDKSKPLSDDLESEICNLIDDDFDNLVSGSPIMIESDKPARRETFTLSKKPSLEGLDQIDKDHSEKTSNPSENNKSKSSYSEKSKYKEMKKDKVMKTESNAPAMLKNKLKNMKTGGHVRRDTYVSENPFKPNASLKRTPLATETNKKQQSSVKGSEGNIENPFKPNGKLKRTPETEETNKKQSSETEKFEGDIENPFKPNNTLKRTPDAEETNEEQISETKRTKGVIENPFKQSDIMKTTAEKADTDKSKTTGKTNGKSMTKEKSKTLLKQQSKSKLITAPKAVVNHSQKPENKVCVDYPVDVPNPFKPTRNLLRSPPPQPKLDSRQFLAKLCNKLGTDEVAEEPPEGPSFVDEPTTYFNADMDLTVPLSTLNKRSPFMNTMENIAEPCVPTDKGQTISTDQSREKTSHASENDIDTEVPDKRKDKTASINSNKLNRVDKKSDQNLGQKGQRGSINEEKDLPKATVEMRVDKPGKFTFAASRKEADGSRKPVPEKVSGRARSKKKHLTPEKDPEPPNLGPDRDLFSFGDRTPTVPLNKILQEKEKASAVYDLSMNESVVGPPVSLHNFREKNKMENGIQENTEQENDTISNESESNVYHLPLKGSPPEKPKRGRGRSKSSTRSKSKSRKLNDSDDEDYVPYKSRSKSKSRKADSDEEYVPHKSRSRSKAKHSDDESNASPSSKPKSRTRGRSRTRKICVETNEEAACEAIKMKDNQPRAEEKADEQELSESPLVRKSASSRARSRARPLITSDDQNDDKLAKDDKAPGTDNVNKDIEENQISINAKERKSRSKSVKDRNEVLENDSDLTLKNGKESESEERPLKNSEVTDKKSKLDNSHVKNTKETEPSIIYNLPLKGSPAESKVKTRTRSKSRSRHVSESDEDPDSHRQMKRRTRSKSCTRHLSESEDEGVKSRSRAKRSRSVVRESSNFENEQQSERKTSTSSHSRPKSEKALENDKLAKEDSDNGEFGKNETNINKDKCNIEMIDIGHSDSDFQSESTCRHRRKSTRQTKLQKDLENDILSENDIESEPTEKELVLNKNKLTKADAIESSDCSPEPNRFVTKSRGRSTKPSSSEHKAYNNKIDIDIVDESEYSNSGISEEQLKGKTPNVMMVKSVRSKSAKKKSKETDIEKSTKVAKKQMDTGDAEEETPVVRKAAKVTSAMTEGLEDSQDQDHVKQTETASKNEKLPAKTPSMPKKSNAGASSKSTKTKTGKSSRKKKEVVVAEDETPKAKTAKKSEKSSQKKVQKENDRPVSRLESLKRRLTTMSSKSSISDDKTQELTNQNVQANVADSEEGIENKRARRTKNPVSYATIPLNKKLRQGDNLFQTKSPITKDKAERARVVLGQHKANLSERTVDNETTTD